MDAILKYESDSLICGNSDIDRIIYQPTILLS